MECDQNLKLILERERRWTPKAFDKFGVTFSGLKLVVPFWGTMASRTYDFSESEKKDRASHPPGTEASLFGNLNSDEIFLLEGEWDLFAAYEKGIINVVTGTNGAQTFTESMAAQLYGKTVYIIYDNDRAGHLGGQKVAKALKSSCAVKIVRLPADVGEGGDVRDYFTKLGRSKDDLLNLVEGTPWEESNRPTVHKLSNVTAKSVEFIWMPRIARGAVTNVIGQPGVGKSFLMAFLAAMVSKGKIFGLDFSRFEQGPVVIFNMEDSLECTIKNRIANAEANEECIYVINDKVKFDDAGISFIRETIRKIVPILVVFDPLTSLLGAEVNMNAANEVRELMEVPIMLAREFNLAVVNVMHTNKNEAARDLLNRSMGSVDFIGAVRSVLMVLRHPQNPDVNLVGHIKSNLSAPANTLSYRIADGKRVEFIESDPRSLQQIIENLEQGQKTKLARQEAIEFAETMLNDWPEKITTLLDEAKQNGISQSTLKRALREVAVRRRIAEKGAGKRGSGYWIWYLSRDEIKYKNIDHLGLLGLWGAEKMEFDSRANQEDQEDQEFEV